MTMASASAPAAAAGTGLSSDNPLCRRVTGLLSFLGVRSSGVYGEQARKTAPKSWLRGGIVNTFMNLGHHEEEAPHLPARIRDRMRKQRESSKNRKQRPADSEGELGDPGPPAAGPVLDMWEVYKKRETRETLNNLFSLFLHICYWLLLMMQIGKAPNVVGLLKHQDAIYDLLLDEEFPDVSFKKNYGDVMTEEEMWQWVDGPLTNAFFPDPGDTEPQPLLGTNYLIGSLQIRQARVDPILCSDTMRSVMQNQVHCAPRWAGADNEEVATAAFGGTSGKLYQAKSFDSKIQGPKILISSQWGGSTAENYGEQGYEVLLPRQQERWRNQTAKLRCSHWITASDGSRGLAEPPEAGCRPFIDHQTRMVAFSFNLLNGNGMASPRFLGTLDALDDINADEVLGAADDTQVLAGQIVFTIDSTGHWDKFYRIFSMRLMSKYFYGVDLVFISWISFVMIALLQDVLDARRDGIELYFKSGMGSFWHCLDVVIYVLIAYTFYVAFIAFDESTDLNNKLKSQMELDDSFIDFMTLRSHMREMSKIMAWVCFFATIKFLKFLHSVEQVSFMWRVVGSAKVDLAAFFCVFLLLLAAFSLFTNQLFGFADRNFHNVPQAFVSLLQMTVGTLDYDYALIRETDTTHAPIFITMFLFIMMLVSVNFFIAILSEAFNRKKEQVKENMKSRKAERENLSGARENVVCTDLISVPSWNVQRYPKHEWMAEHMGVESVLSVHPAGADGGAPVICLHLFKTEIRLDDDDDEEEPVKRCSFMSKRLTGSSSFDRFDNFVPEGDDTDGYNALTDDAKDYRRAVFLQLLHEGVSSAAQHTLLELKMGEPITLREPGAFGKVIKCKVVHIFQRTRNVDFGDTVERWHDFFINLAVVEVVSWQGFSLVDSTSIMATPLQKKKSKGDSWKMQDDITLHENFGIPAFGIKRRYQNALRTLDPHPLEENALTIAQLATKMGAFLYLHAMLQHIRTSGAGWDERWEGG
jgi:hypothetical protein